MQTGAKAGGRNPNHDDKSNCDRTPSLLITPQRTLLVGDMTSRKVMFWVLNSLVRGSTHVCKSSSKDAWSELFLKLDSTLHTI